MKLILNLKQLKAALLTAGSKDLRYYLNGVFVEATPSFYRLVSTDGSNMGVFHVTQETNAPPFNVIIPREVILDLPKSTPELVVLREENGAWFLGALSFRPIEGKFPDYRRILAQVAKPSNEPAHISALCMVNFQKVADLLVKKGATVRVWQNGGANGSAVTVAGAPEYVGVTMPVNPTWLEKQAGAFPTWLGL